jgi:hypothetical protein
MALNFGPPLIDFTPLGKLGAEYDAGVKRNREAEVNAARQKALAGFGQNSDLAQLGAALLHSGDLEGGMSALRLQAANEGTPWQKQRAAAEDQRAADAAAETKTQHQRDEEYRKRQEERQNDLVPVERDNDDGYKEIGKLDPTTGITTWPDGTTTQGPVSRRFRERRSDLGDDPNAPAVGGNIASAQLDPTTTGSVSPRPQFVMPGTLQGIPSGSPDDLAAQQRGGQAPLAALAPPAAAGTTAVAAMAPQAAPLAPPAASGNVAVAQAAQPAQPTVAAPPITDAQVNQGTTRIPPESVDEQRAKAKSMGMNLKEYREIRKGLIKKDLEAQQASGVTPDMKNKLAQARAMAQQLMPELDSLNDDVKEYGTELYRGPVKTRMQVKKTNIVMMLKDLYALGALQKGDMEQIDQMISDPTSDNPIDYMIKGATQKDVTDSQVKAIKRLVAMRLQAAESTLGGDPSKVTVPLDQGALGRLKPGGIIKFDENGNPVQ